MQPSISRRGFYIIFGVFSIAFIVSTLFYVPAGYLNPSAVIHHVRTRPRSDNIPNIVHYVWIIKDGHDFGFGFKQFVSVYSAHLYIKPDIIYIHTDATPLQFNNAKQNGDEWTRRILNLPGIVHNEVTVPTQTSLGKPIGHIEHKADFIRTAMLELHGGFYLDMDAVPLRDVKDLRESGFANVVGMQITADSVNNGVMMCKPNSTLISIYKPAQHETFNGQWNTHGTELLSELSFRLQPMPNEVLILGLKAFAPSSWRVEDETVLWKPHAETKVMPLGKGGELPPVPKTKDEAMDWWNARKSREAMEDWQLDYSGSYVIHAFDNSPVPGWDMKVTLEYCLARQSNFARAVYPAIWHAIQAGIIVLDENQKEIVSKSK